MNFSDIGNRIRERRKQLGMSRELFSERVGISVGHLSLVERGERFVRAENLLKISDVLSISTDYILKGSKTALLHDSNKEQLIQLIDENVVTDEKAQFYINIFLILNAYPIDSKVEEHMYNFLKLIAKFIYDNKKPLDD